MRRGPSVLLTLIATAAAAAISAQSRSGDPSGPPGQEGVVFQAGVDLVRVTTTVTDGSGRFVTGLRKEDFVVYEDEVRQEIAQFTSDRTPVSLGILLDASGSMSTEKINAAREAIDRLIYDLLGKDDELFFVEFADNAAMPQDWTRDRRLISRAVRDVRATGNTALYDAIATAIPKAETGTHRKKALLVISDGNDSRSMTTVTTLRELIRESEVLVYALGIDSVERPEPPRQQPPRIPMSGPFPTPGRPGIEVPRFPPMTPPIANTFPRNAEERVNSDVLHRITDDTGGLTEIVRGVAGLSRATSRIADELSRQYDLAYASNREKDRRWHVIRVEVPGRRVTVRARRGYYG